MWVYSCVMAVGLTSILTNCCLFPQLCSLTAQVTTPAACVWNWSPGSSHLTTCGGWRSCLEALTARLLRLCKYFLKKSCIFLKYFNLVIHYEAGCCKYSRAFVITVISWSFIYIYFHIRFVYENSPSNSNQHFSTKKKTN